MYGFFYTMNEGNNGGSSAISLCAYVLIQCAYALFLRLLANVEYDKPIIRPYR